MPRIASAIRQLREAYTPAAAIAVDIGDHLDRMSSETEGSVGRANIDVMNETGYELAVLGNNEGLTFEFAELDRLYRNHARFGGVVSNMVRIGGGPPDWIRPCAVMERNGVKVAFIGLTAPFNAFYHPLGWNALSPLDTARYWVRKLRNEADLVVVLSHLGLPVDERMAREIEGIDCIIGAHTHHFLPEPYLVNGTLIAASGKFGTHVGDVTLRWDTDKRALVERTARCVPVDDYPEDEAVKRLIDRHAREAKIALGGKVAELRTDLDHRPDAESPLGNLLALGIRQWTGAEIGIVNAGQLLFPLTRGTVTRETLLRLCPSPINPCHMDISGEAIRQTLEQSLLEEYIFKPIKGFGFRGEVLGTLCIEGMEIVYDPSRPAYRKIVSAKVNGAPLDPNRMYRVGTIDMFTFGSGYPNLQHGENVHYYLPEFLRDLLRFKLEDEAAIRRSFRRRWKTV